MRILREPLVCLLILRILVMVMRCEGSVVVLLVWKVVRWRLLLLLLLLLCLLLLLLY